MRYVSRFARCSNVCMPLLTVLVLILLAAGPAQPATANVAGAPSAAMPRGCIASYVLAPEMQFVRWQPASPGNISAVIVNAMFERPLRQSARITLLLPETYAGAVQSVIAGFNEQYPNIAVEMNPVPAADLWTIFNTGAAAGTPPDIIMGDSNHASMFLSADNGVLRPLTDIIEDYGGLFSDTARAAVSVRGTPYGVPLFTHTTALVYNQWLLDEAGFNGVPTSWDDARNIAANLGNGRGLYVAPHPYFFYGLQTGFGGAVYGDAPWQLNNPGAVAALEWAVGMIADDFMPPVDYSEAVSRFGQGELALIVDGPWNLDRYEQSGAEACYTAPILSGPEGSGETLMYTTAFFVSQSAAHMDTALTFLRYMIEQGGIELLSVEVDLPPALRSAEDRMEPENSLRAYAHNAENGFPIPAYPPHLDIWEDALTDVYYGRLSPAEALDEAQYEYEERLAELDY